jgi:hypothetical protein
MSSFLRIELDTTKPKVDIYAPNSTTIETDSLIRIQANEILSNIQNFYFLDSLGARHDFTLDYQESLFEGYVSFNNFSEGMATLVAEVYDEVLNKSTTSTFNIAVFKTRAYRLELNVNPRVIIALYKSRTEADEESNPYYAKLIIKPRNKINTDLSTLE